MVTITEFHSYLTISCNQIDSVYCIVPDEERNLKGTIKCTTQKDVSKYNFRLQKKESDPAECRYIKLMFNFYVQSSDRYLQEN